MRPHSKDTYEAAEVVREQLLVHPEVKVVVYSGHKATPAQRDSVMRLPFPKGTTTAGGSFERLSTGPTYDSVYTQRTYHNKQVVGVITARPHR